MTSILFAILIQAPYKPEPVKLPESHIIIERFMLKGEETAGKATGYLATTYAIVEGDSENDVLEKEYAFTKGLDDLKRQGIITGYIATTSFVPPQSVQTAHIRRFAARKLGHIGIIMVVAMRRQTVLLEKFGVSQAGQ